VGLSKRTGISLQATARRLGDDSKQARCAIIYYRGGATGKLMDAHIYSSTSFEERFRWRSGRFPAEEVKTTVREAARAGEARAMHHTDVKDRILDLHCEAIDTPRAVIALISNEHSRPLASMFPVRRR